MPSLEVKWERLSRKMQQHRERRSAMLFSADELELLCGQMYDISQANTQLTEYYEKVSPLVDRMVNAALKGGVVDEDGQPVDIAGELAGSETASAV